MSKVNRCSDDLRYAYKNKVPLEKVLNSYNIYGAPIRIPKETYKNICFYVYKTNLDNEGILKKINKYPDYESFLSKQNNFTKFFIERPPEIELPKRKQTKKYTTYTSHGHFQTNNPISALLNYFALK